MNTAPLRAAARIASRGARRNVPRSILVIAMVSLPVALVTATATVARTTVAGPEAEIARRLGAADVSFSFGRNFDVDELRTRLPVGSDIVRTTFEEDSLIRRGALVNATILEPEPGLESPLLRGLYELEAGRVPKQPGEVALHRDLLAGFDAEIGDDIELGEHSLRVVGLVRVPQDLDHHIAIVAPGTLSADAASGGILVDLPSGTLDPSVHKWVRRQGGSVTTRDEVAARVVNDAAVWDGVSLVGGVLALFATGLIAAAAFVVGARRQLRELGMVGAIGGEPRHVRAVVWLGGTTLGFVGGLLGSVLGVGIAFAVHPFLDPLVGRVVGPVDVNVLMLIAAVLMGTVAATLAALAPARSAGKLSVVAALAGRTPPPRPPGRLAGFGLLILVAGGVLTAWAMISDQNAWLAVGLVGMLLGILLAIPMLVSFVGSMADRLPTAGRLAARDAARHGRRTGAAVAAAVIALAVPVAVSTYSLSEETYERRSPRLGDDQLLIGQLADVASAGLTDDIASDVRRAFPKALTVPLRQAVTPRKDGGRGYDVFAFGAREELSPGVATVTSWPLFVADGDLLRAVHGEDGVEPLSEGKAVVLGGFDTNKGFVRVRVPAEGGGERSVKLPAVAVESPAYFNESIPRIVISQDTADELGLSEYVSLYLLTSPGPLSSDDIDRARQIAADHPGFFVHSNEDYLPKYALARSAATAASVPLALAVLAVAVALVASESRRSHQILVAIGAGPLAHRKVVAATSALLALIAAVLAVPAGFLPTVVVQAASQAGRPLVVPWPTIAIMVLVTPVLSAAVAGVVARTPKLDTLLTPAT